MPINPADGLPEFTPPAYLDPPTSTRSVDPNATATTDASSNRRATGRPPATPGTRANESGPALLMPHALP
ncbi:MAG TPA: hypothetical protein VGP31_19855 [Planosporangium sp.]|jgi:hypothetical protein|nr:hypothetical protein [Planosporangium sp.]